MSESMPPTLAQMQQLNRSLTEKILDRASSDPEWKQLLLDDPEAALREANFPETQQLEQIQASAGREGEVRGQALPGGADVARDPYEDFWEVRKCYWWTHYWA